VLDTDEHLVDLVLAADADAREDLRRRVLAPLEEVRPSSRPRLEETLRAWLLCQGRREDVAALLFVHPQTVRYRMGRLRELFGDRLTDPAGVRELLVALA
jgi:DNA-binding PucR family transcriptional regulator